MFPPLFYKLFVKAKAFYATDACIGCGKCAKECQFDAIKVENNVAYIDFMKCRLCRKCAAACPTHAIHELNFPPRPAVKPEAKTPEAQAQAQEQAAKAQ